MSIIINTYYERTYACAHTYLYGGCPGGAPAPTPRRREPAGLCPHAPARDIIIINIILLLLIIIIIIIMIIIVIVIYIYIHTYIHIHAYMCIYMCIYIYIYTCIHVSQCTYTYIYIYIYIHIHIHTYTYMIARISLSPRSWWLLYQCAVCCVPWPSLIN